MRHDKKMVKVLVTKVEAAQQEYTQSPTPEKYKRCMTAFSNLSQYMQACRSSMLDGKITDLQGMVQSVVNSYLLNNSSQTYDNLLNLTQLIGHLLLLQRAVSGKSGSAMALQALAQQYPLNCPTNGKLNREKIKDMLLNTDHLSETQINNLLNKLSVTSESVGGLTIDEIQLAFENKQITTKEMNNMLQALQQKRQLAEDVVATDGKIGFCEEKFYQQLGH